ncbi:helix-turn-helix transcriptional regulator [Cohnella nanjingensis]|uniref:Helix-turn-helix transcriptional regulator n=1 Tax=Cohnella nanjingensis TaxID=1387779 RepID=A0A7X0VIK0_9BACL|nr:helix-turn-helix transcriptional regulator [Cohnella nanjingensis]MBB6673734.1 helix-turn-helix transcriptional regulator [Cohnella nanjingensis]
MKNRVKIARIEHGNLSQEELADLIGVSRQTISLIESGKYNPTLKLCLALSKVLNKKLDDLFWMEEDAGDE